MKIKERYPDKIPLQKPLFLKKPSSALRTSAIKEPNTFQKELSTAQKKDVSQRLKKILSDIDEEGKKLTTLRTLNILNQYKELIRVFLKESLQNLYLLKEKTHFDSKGKHKVLIMVENVNKALEDIVKMVINKEAANLKLLEKIDEIKGLLIDLYS